MSNPIESSLATQARESARQLLAAVEFDGSNVGLGDQLAAVTDELCWEVGLVDVTEDGHESVEGARSAAPRGWPRLDHVGIIVANLEAALRFWKDQLGGVLVAGGDARADGIRTAHVRFDGGGKVELLTPLGSSAAADHLARRGEGVHHLTFAGFDVATQADLFQSAGLPLGHLDLNSNYMRQLFVGPRSANGVAVQVVDATDHYTAVGTDAVPTSDELLAGQWVWRDGVPVRLPYAAG